MTTPIKRGRPRKEITRPAVTLQVRGVNEELWLRAKVLATKEGRTYAEVINAALESYLA